jgi:glutamate carboxypeptidase
MSFPSYENIRALAVSQKYDAQALLKELVLIQSGTRNEAGVTAAQEVVKRELLNLGLKITTHRGKDKNGFSYADNLLGRNFEGEDLSSSYVIDVHLDTVFLATEEPTFTTSLNKCFGQGVVDMKGGVVVALSALKILNSFQLLNSLPLLFLAVSDEEKQSPVSSKLIEQIALKKPRLAMVFESAGSNYEYVSQRKGAKELAIKVKGKSGHAGNITLERYNAIEELAYKIVKIRELAHTFISEGMLFNVGLISGGISHNTIAEDARCAISLRYQTDKSLKDFLVQANQIIAQPDVRGCKAELIIEEEQMPVMTRSPEADYYCEIFQRAVLKTGLSIEAEARGGGSNACWWSYFGVPAIDGLGPRGGDDHTLNEWMDLESLTERTIHVTLFLLELMQSDKKLI